MLRLNVLILRHKRCYRNQILFQDSPELLAEIFSESDPKRIKVDGPQNKRLYNNGHRLPADSSIKIGYLLLLDHIEEFCECPKAVQFS